MISASQNSGVRICISSKALRRCLLLHQIFIAEGPFCSLVWTSKFSHKKAETLDVQARKPRGAIIFKDGMIAIITPCVSEMSCCYKVCIQEIFTNAYSRPNFLLDIDKCF